MAAVQFDETDDLIDICLAACCTCGIFAYICKNSRLSGLLMQFERYKSNQRFAFTIVNFYTILR
jgi:hypothetical protein